MHTSYGSILCSFIPLTGVDGQRWEIPCEDVFEDGTHVRNSGSHAKYVPQKCALLPSETFPLPLPLFPFDMCGSAPTYVGHVLLHDGNTKQTHVFLCFFLFLQESFRLIKTMLT